MWSPVGSIPENRPILALRHRDPVVTILLPSLADRQSLPASPGRRRPALDLPKIRDCKGFGLALYFVTHCEMANCADCSPEIMGSSQTTWFRGRCRLTLPWPSRRVVWPFPRVRRRNPGALSRKVSSCRAGSWDDPNLAIG